MLITRENLKSLLKTATSSFLLIWSMAYIAIYGAIYLIVDPSNPTYLALYYLPKVIPLIVAGVFIVHKNPPVYRPFEILGKSVAVIVGATAIVVSILALMINHNILTEMLTSIYNWSVPGWLCWNYGFLLFFGFSYLKTKEATFSLIYSVLGISAGGMIYEIPVSFMDYQTYFHPDYPLFITTSWVSFIVLLWMLKKKHWKPTWHFGVTLAMYIAFSVVYGLLGNGVGMWLPRIITVFLLASLPFGFKKTIPSS